ncbi:DgyrCDS5349 [Dimorphilus gyrociliatus]|uniref:inositol-polyphosphate 5-phosphatase n=1 Tax=Dimorphilus gyrociliatus TaxID=2664684 RepID=A0A7I8VL96_9ANNE|nr:DgyrCDS5349 [Dimorphilus gyrociliatus]
MTEREEKENDMKVLFITTNIGSIFEVQESDSADNSKPTMMDKWIECFIGKIRDIGAHFVAIHCQEVGGKDYVKTIKYVDNWAKKILNKMMELNYDKSRLFLDEDCSAPDKFTALGNLYFVHKDVVNIDIYDFATYNFTAIGANDHEILSGNIEKYTTKEKAKFPQNYFPDCKWSRKGFMRTRWRVNNKVVYDLVNIHLFHDANNITAMEASPSIYAKNRKRALQHTLDRFEEDEHQKAPMFIFGDFNFRLDTHYLIKSITGETKSREVRSKRDEVTKIDYLSTSDPTKGEIVLTIEKKGFEHYNHHDVFLYNHGQWMRDFDKEAREYDRLEEFPINFSPSYPYMENINDGMSFMKSRVPAWCDRIMYTKMAKNLMDYDSTFPLIYDLIGADTCMGDHKPVFLLFKLRATGAGNVILFIFYRFMCLRYIHCLYTVYIFNQSKFF